MSPAHESEVEGAPKRPRAPLVQPACSCANGDVCDQCGPGAAPATPVLPQLAPAGVFANRGTGGFMKQLRADVTDLANAELAEVGRTADKCPYIARWLDHYDRRDGAHLERAIQRYAKPGENSVDGYHAAILSRVRGALRVWKSSGEITGVPDEVYQSDLSDAGMGGSMGSGSPLDGATRTHLESAYGQPLGGVRVHTGGQPAEMARGMSALAFTVGNDIAFAPGMYRPGSRAGDALIAHEVAHTIQQGGEAHPADALDSKTEASLEQEADAAAAGALGTGPAVRPAVHGGLRMQRCDFPDCDRLPQSGLRLDIERKRDCGLLSPPMLPPGMPEFPVYEWEDDLGNRPIPNECYPMGRPPIETMASLGLGGPGALAMGKRAGGAFAQAQVPFFEPMPMPPVEPVPFFEPMPIPPIEPLPLPPIEPLPLPPIEPLPLPPVEPLPIPPTWPYPIPPVMPMPDPNPAPVPNPDIREDDQRYLDRLTPEQKDYYRWLREAERLEPEPGEDADDELPDVCPLPDPGLGPEPNPDEDEDEDEEEDCIAYPVRRRGGHAEHDAYATLKSGETRDWYAQAPSGADISYDGKTPSTHIVWEVKVRHGWFFNCNYRSLRDRVLARWDAQKDRGMAVAAECGYFHIWACKDRWVAGLLRQRWGGAPPVIT